jgi:hypothetical protein
VNASAKKKKNSQPVNVQAEILAYREVSERERADARTENFAGASLKFNSRDVARALFADTGRKIRLPDWRETG